jgi:hypothetical protein
LVAGGWKTKPLHKLILTSATYRQSSIHPKQDEYARADAGNRLWWRAERRRLDAEALRDALLAAGGNLRLDTVGGPSFAPDIPPDALEGLSTKGDAYKASPAAEQGRGACTCSPSAGCCRRYSPPSTCRTPPSRTASGT